MAKRFYAFLILAIALSTATAQQQILLFAENFENATNPIVVNGSGVGTNSGPNLWTINKQFTGQPAYPNTPPQDSVVSGTITAAPFSNYLHIHNSGNTTVANANFNPATASDRFSYIGSPFCTLGLTDVIFTFFWLCEGNDNAYGELYYRIDGGAWIKTGQNKYNNQRKWKYEVVQDPAFNNVENLQLGFRWVNPNSTDTANNSFAIDDIIAVGNYDAINNPARMSIFLVQPTTVCQDDFVTVGYRLNHAMCAASYKIEMSNAFGNFSQIIDLGAFNIGSDTVGYIGFQAPDNVLGNCFRIRIRRVDPDPKIVSDTSICITIQDCPEQIITKSAPVMMDADTTCLLSVIDVKFNSYGVFNPGQRYIAELSDSNGLFADSTFLGNNYTDEAYPDPSNPGNIAGLIPASVPPGCGYYIRVRSTSPRVTGSIIGPFCLTKCDELTNDHEDMHFCIASGPYPLCDTLNIHPNQWTNTATYDTCNTWTIELRDMMDFSLKNSGGLGIIKDSIGGKFLLCMPSTVDSLPVQPGSYYMRIVSSCGSVPYDQTGSVIRLTVGAPDVIAPTITSPDSLHCNQGVVEFLVNPFKHPPSDYEWTSNAINNGNPFTWEFNPLRVDFTGAPLNEYIFYVREINFGCVGPSSASTKITIIGVPQVNVSGPIQVCLGDTVTYKVGYLKETYYNWTAPPGVKILDEANSETTIIFDSLGTYTLSNYSLNACGSGTDSITVNVVTLYTIDAGADKAICQGDSVELEVNTGMLNKVLTTTTNGGAQGKPGAMFNIKAHEEVLIDSFAVFYLCNDSQRIIAEIYDRPGTYRGFATSGAGWNQVGSYYNFLKNPGNQMTAVPIQVNRTIPKDSTYAFYVTTANTAPVVNMRYSSGIGLQQEVVYTSDGIIDFIQGAVLDYPFTAPIGPRVLNCRVYYSTRGGLHYMWNTGDSTAKLIVKPEQTTDYSVIVFDTAGCQNFDNVTVSVNPKPDVNAGPDTIICKGVDYVMPATASTTTVNWEPQAGLSDYNTLNPSFNYNDSILYTLTATDNLGCKNVDSVMLKVKGPFIDAGNDTTLCPDAQYQIQLNNSSGDSNILWSPSKGLNSVTVVNPVFAFDSTVTYTVRITDENGCIAYDSITISVEPCSSYIKVPSAFTPNRDGNNDVFMVFGKNIAQYEIQIYNRWGEMVYNSRDVSELSNVGQGWDGMYKGAMQDLGTFVYYIKAKDLSGNDIEKKGNLTLIR